MIIEIKEKQLDKEPYRADIEDVKIGFIVGWEECDYDYNTDKWLGVELFCNLF